MKQVNIYLLGVFFLVLLLSHEGIAVANRINEGVYVQKQLKMHDVFKKYEVTTMDGMDGDLFSFLEVQDMQGMSTEAYATHEIKEIHKSLKESFTFDQSPILNEVGNLKEIPHDKILSPSELKAHRTEISMLLEKAMQGPRKRNKKAPAKRKTKAPSLGNCKRTTWGTCGKHTDCQSDPKDPCRGECMCDDDGLNECTCVPKGRLETLSLETRITKIDAGTILDNEKVIDKVLTVVADLGWTITFGFVDGFLGGMVTDLKDGWDGKCQDRSEMKAKFKRILHTGKQFWHDIKKIHKKIWTNIGRQHLIKAMNKFLEAMHAALGSLWKYAVACPATKLIGTILLVISIMVILNMAFIAAGFVVIPLIIKIVGGLVGLYGSFDYIKNTILKIYQEIKKMRAGTCTNVCERNLVEKSSAIIGAIVEVILYGGIDDYAKISKNTEATRFFKKFKIDFSDDFLTDIASIKKASKKAKNGVFTKLQNIGKSLRNDGLMRTIKKVVKRTGDTVTDVAKKATNKVEDLSKVANDGDLITKFAFDYKFKREFGKWCDTEKYGLYSSYSAKKNTYNDVSDFAGEMA